MEQGGSDHPSQLLDKDERPQWQKMHHQRMDQPGEPEGQGGPPPGGMGQPGPPPGGMGQPGPPPGMGQPPGPPPGGMGQPPGPPPGMGQPPGPPPGGMGQPPGPPPGGMGQPPGPPPGGMGQQGPPPGMQGDMSDDLMMKVRQQQQMLDFEKKREAQQKLMEQQRLALLEAQRRSSNSGAPMTPAGMPTTPSIRSSGVGMVSAPLQSQQGVMQGNSSAPRPPMPNMMSQQPPRGPPMRQSGPRPLMRQMVERPPMSQGGPPQMTQGGPQMSQGGPPMMSQQGGPQMSQGGPQMSQGGPPMSQQGGPPMSQGGPPMSQGGPPMMSQQGGPRPPMQQGGPMPPQGGPPQGGPPMSQSGGPPPMQQGGPPQQQQRGPPMSQSGAQMSQNAPPSQAGPQGGNKESSGGGDSGGRPSGAARPYNGPAGMPPRSTSSRPNASTPLSQGPKEMRLAPALEKMLEFKSLRETEVGADKEDKENGDDDGEESGDEESEMGGARYRGETGETGEREEVNEEVNEEDVEEEESTEVVSSKGQTKESKNKRKKKKKKKARRNRFEQQKKPKKKDKKSKAPEVIVEYIQEQPELDPYDPNYHTFARIFEAFKIEEPEKPKEVKPEHPEETKPKEEAPPKMKGLQEDDDDDDDDDELVPDDDDGPKISKKKLKKLTRLTVAQLKQLVTRPDVVEMHDVTARDPRLLVHLKATRNSVPVPRHWCYKRKYLQGKRGIEKTPFELPDFIKATGIEEMRAALQEKEDQKTLKSKMREKVRPKMGKIDIDYQKLHDAFFRFQTKPKMTVHGDLYYEAKEFETKLREKKPGNLSDDLKMALGMPVGANSEKVPPPWLIAMQRYGPPPSYPNLKIAGLNAPIPEGCMFGYHAGGWGKPPVDEHGKPLYGDVFGTQNPDFKTDIEEDDIDKSAWGELESESESESESEEEEEEEKDESGLITPAEGLMTPGGITSVPLGMETPDQIELRKRRIEDAMDQGGDTPALYQVLPEKKAAPVGGAMMGSAHVYDMAGVPAAPKKPGDKVSVTEAVEVSLNPEELDLDSAAMQAKYDQTVREQQSQLEKEDLSDMVAAHAAKQRKRKKAQQDTGKTAKKYKDFKF